MNSTLAALVLVAAMATVVQAQEPRHPMTMPDTGMAGMPGMKRAAPAARDSGAHRRHAHRPAAAARDTGMRHMRGMGHMGPMRGMREDRGPDSATAGMRMPRVAAMQDGMAGMAMAGPLGIPDSRDGSGTAWQPDVTPMHALHGNAGRWSLMFHGNAFLQYIGEGSRRGEQQLGSVNWLMGMARRPLAGGDLALRGMISLEPLTVGKCGYPDLLATGEQCNGQALHDRQHPHDMFMEVAALYQRALTRNLAFELYGGPAGEPALGPVAFPHRTSALWSPIAPISHHWQDATHIAFGVVTGGVYGRRWKVEGSAFNGREPDDQRFDFDLGALDSYSWRLWLLPTERLALQVSAGYLHAAEQVPDGMRSDVHRSTASLAYHVPLAGMRFWANTLVWGQNRAHGQVTNATLLESSLDLNGRDVVFARGELAQKSGEDLALEGAPLLATGVFRVGKLALGYARRLGGGSWTPGVGAEVSLSRVPAALEPFYGSTTSGGFALYATLRPRAMRMDEEHALAPRPAPMPGMTMPGAEPVRHRR